MLPARRLTRQIGASNRREARPPTWCQVHGPGPLPYRRASWSGACEYSSSSEQGRQMPCDTRRWGVSAPRPRPSGRPHQAQTTVSGAGSGDNFSRVARGAGASVRELRLGGIKELPVAPRRALRTAGSRARRHAALPLYAQSRDPLRKLVGQFDEVRAGTCRFVQCRESSRNYCDGVFVESARATHNRANCQSASTVRLETANASAISSMVSPPKMRNSSTRAARSSRVDSDAIA